MVTIKLYIEGGGQGKDLDARFREGWRKFFEKAGLRGRMPRVVRCGSRQKAFDDFENAVKNASKQNLPLLLVDSESPVSEKDTVWQHLSKQDNRTKPEAATDEQAYLMVQVMETWFLADTATLKKYFGQDFDGRKIQAWSDLESRSKESVFEVLKKCTNNKYEKGEVSFKLMAAIQPEQVTAHCPHAQRLLDFLRK